MPRYIDADALKKDLTRFYDSEVTARELIDEQPTADVQPVKHGKWINTNNPNHLRCSNCDIIHMIAQYPNGKISYCPNCGSYNGMDGGSE